MLNSKIAPVLLLKDNIFNKYFHIKKLSCYYLENQLKVYAVQFHWFYFNILLNKISLNLILTAKHFFARIFLILIPLHHHKFLWISFWTVLYVLSFMCFSQNIKLIFYFSIILFHLNWYNNVIFLVIIKFLFSFSFFIYYFIVYIYYNYNRISIIGIRLSKLMKCSIIRRISLCNNKNHFNCIFFLFLLFSLVFFDRSFSDIQRL